ncbi:hypothetical protein [Robiginitomaculum antarcticum]|uniref:hypothetical protein n=1 Tax=Robiginitomaculum antarcticum TaxID=437507 RepID=UPI00035C7D79|nr:hypothetical protein [Robiginitomaculum antarcticum]
MSEDSTIQNNDAISVKGAADRLQRAVASLSAALTPIKSRIDALETQHAGQSRLEEDRRKLSGELDSAMADANLAKKGEADAKARAEQLLEREAEFSKLAEETMQEMDMVISQVKLALGKE